jgi:F-type H+-transporting ATPase subunit gamma
MITIRELRSRIRATKNIEHITSAMQKVSAARLNKARQRLVAVRPYADTLEEMARDLVAEYNLKDHPLFKQNPGNRALVVALNADKGLCGAYNSAIATQLDQFIKAHSGSSVEVLACGKKIRDHCRRKNIKLFAESINTPVFFKFNIAQKLADDIMAAYETGGFSQVHLLYTRFVSASHQETALAQLLPFAFIACNESAVAHNFIYEPSPKAIMQGLIPSAIRTRVWEALLDASASEHAFRMIMMEQASVNADKMITELVQTANKLRQSMITKELSEIVGTSEALK